MSISKEKQRKNIAKNEEMNPNSFSEQKMNLDSFLSLLIHFRKVKWKLNEFRSGLVDYWLTNGWN